MRRSPRSFLVELRAALREAMAKHLGREPTASQAREERQAARRGRELPPLEHARPECDHGIVLVERVRIHLYLSCELCGRDLPMDPRTIAGLYVLTEASGRDRRICYRENLLSRVAWGLDQEPPTSWPVEAG